MKTFLSRALGVVGIAAAAASLLAAEPGDPGSNAQGGLQVTLTTGGYRFFAETSSGSDPGAVRSGRTANIGARESFPASAILFNRSNSDINFSFGDPVSAQRHFRFRVFDSGGKEIWSSESGAAIAVVTQETLSRRSAWRRTVRVPLQLEGKPLAAGVYTLEALVDADKQFSATTIFEVLSSPTPDPKETGIKGLVLRASSGPVATTAAGELPIAGAQIMVTEVVNDQPTLRAPFFWQSVTNGDGRFQVNAPPGRYRVKATLPPAVGVAGLVPVEPPAVVSRTIEVTVEAGKYAEAVFHFGPPNPPVVADTGIRGRVWIGPITPVVRDGEPNEAPLAGAKVTVEEIRLPNARYSRPPFNWAGVTNAEGRFQVAAPAGRFVVTARQALVVIDPPAGTILQASGVGLPGSEATIEVTVAEGKFSEVSLHLDSGIR